MIYTYKTGERTEIVNNKSYGDWDENMLIYLSNNPNPSEQDLLSSAQSYWSSTRSPFQNRNGKWTRTGDDDKYDYAHIYKQQGGWQREQNAPENHAKIAATKESRVEVDIKIIHF